MNRLINFIIFTFIFIVIFISPTAYAQWIKPTDGLYGGRINDLNVNSLGHIFAASYGGVFKSTDSGDSWTSVDDELTNVEAIAVSGSKIIAGTFLKGIYLSTNDGQSWIQIDNGPISGKQTNAIAIDGSNIFIATRYAVFLTNDDGTNWTDISDSLAGKWFNTIAVHNSRVYVGTNDGLFVSPDSGTSWTPLKNGLTRNMGISFAFSGSNIFAGTEGGVFLSMDNGTSWTEINNGLPSPYVYTLTVSGSILFAGTMDGVYITTNNGASWEQRNAGLTNIQARALLVSGPNTITGTEGGIFVSDDNGQNWQESNFGLTSTTVYSLAISGSNIYAGTYGNGVFFSSNNGASWSVSTTGLTSLNVLSLAINGSDILAGTTDGVFLSTDNGNTWNERSSGITSTYIRDLEFRGTKIFAGTQSGGIFVSEDYGLNWTAVNNGLTSLTIYALAISGGNIFAGTATGGVFLSIDDGQNWSPINNGLEELDIRDLAVNAPRLFAATRNRAFVSDNNGSSWRKITTLGGGTVSSVAVIGSNLFAGPSFNGVYISQDNGDTWDTINEGLPSRIPVEAFVSDESRLYIGTGYNGLYYRSLSDLSPPNAPTNLTANAVSTTQINLNWTASTSATVAMYRIYRKSDGSFAAVDSIDGIITSYNDINLQSATMYTYYVEAVNIFGSSLPSNQESAMTFTEPPSAPTNLTATAVSVTQIDLSWTASATGSPSLYRISRSAETGFAVIDSVEGFLTTYSDTTVQLGVEYTYFVDAKNLGGYSAQSNQANATTSDPESPVISSVTSVPSIAEFGNDLIVSAVVTDNHAVSSVILDYRSGIETSFSSQNMNLSGEQYSTTIPGTKITPTGLIYRVIATDTQDNHDTLATIATISFPEAQSSTATLQGNSYQSGFPEDVWRMISIPLNLNNKSVQAVLNDFGPSGDKSWRLFKGSDNDVSTSGAFDIGVAFWLKQILGEGAKEIKPGSGTSSSLEQARITLLPGWNQIGNPFTFAIDWELDTDAGDYLFIKGPIKWDGTKYVGIGQTSGDETPFAELLPWDGYWVYNSSNSSQVLTINPTGSSGQTGLWKETRDQNQSDRDKMDLRVHFSVQVGKYSDIFNYIGAVKDASDFEDYYDLPELPVIGDYASLFFNHKYEDGSVKPFTIDYKTCSEEGYQWNMAVKTNVNDEMNTLKWTTINLPENYHLAILDISNNKLIDINSDLYSFTNKYEQHPVTFKIFAGSEEYVRQVVEEERNKLPDKYDLAQNYPNPFNPTTAIGYRLLAVSDVELGIYNILGQKVAVLVSERQSAGSYQVQWDGTDQHGKLVSSGLYIYMIRADQFSASKKMIILR